MITEKVDPILIQPLEPGSRLSGAVRLFAALDQAGVRYCHWKSNIRLVESLAGKTDLDLLIDSQNEQAFRDILSGQGFKPLSAPFGKRFPGIEHHLGFDLATGRLIHLHVHFQLVLGEQHVKNYHLPLEHQFLGFTIQREGVITPASELELIILVVRALLKYRDRDGIKDVLSIRSPGIPVHIQDEIRWLEGQIAPGDFEKTLADMSSVLPADTIRCFLALIKERPRAGFELLRLRASLRRSLRPYQRQERLAASASYFRTLWRKSWHGEQQMSLPGKGKRIALVGVDGSGKTSLSQAVAAWLSWKVDTHLFYLGSKQPSWWSSTLYWFFRIARRSQTESARLLGESNLLARLAGSIKWRLLARHYLSIGRDRYRRYRLGNQLAGGGSVLIYDRYPFETPLDGPEIENIPVDNPASLAKIARREKDLYAQFLPVDLLILLEAPADVSALRKPDHPLAVIQAKNAALENLKQQVSQAGPRWNWVTLDATRPLDEVLLQVKRAVWEAL